MYLLSTTFPVFLVPKVNLFVEPGQITITSASIRNHVVDVTCVLANDCIVDDASILIQQNRERRTELGQ